jgi:hypothetical protein
MNTRTKDKGAKKVADAFLNVQERFALFMNKKTKGCPTRMMKVWFLLVCTVFISLSVCCIVNAFGKKPASPPDIVTHMRMVPLIPDQDKSVTIVSVAAYNRLQQFRKYMDSLRMCERVHYDSILLTRPGLLDTISILERIYLQQKK